ncbi:casein kinase I-like [Contarinia nasturtii]|uniref:casein kinase I-like n=1 Tax=Contarinia nasturtii TaxID=265458 RepID=UPI0012D43FB6|nr:casein kinase I-like [Contarinia nasturtii]
MNSHLYFLSIIGLSFLTIGEMTSVSLIKSNILHLFANGVPEVTVSKDHHLKLLNKGKLAETDHALVWKGTYDNKAVACKLFCDKKYMDEEMKIFKALNATKNLDKEPHEIPRIFYHGPILGKYHAIAMTLFDGTLLDRYVKQDEKLSDFSILLIFKQAVEALEFLHSNKVLHNDIKPENIFLRGSEVFFSDFHLSTLNGYQKRPCSPMFGSASYYAGFDRDPMDDFESLLYSIWYIGNVPMGRVYGRDIPEGRILLGLDEQEAISRMVEKSKHFKDKNVQKAFRFTNMQIISGKSKPDYKEIIKKLTEAIAEVSKTTGQERFEWLTF